MTESTLTSKGQTAVPIEVRKIIGAAAGTRMAWHVMPDGGLIVRAKNKSILDSAGVLREPEGKRAAVPDVNAWR